MTKPNKEEIDKVWKVLEERITDIKNLIDGGETKPFPLQEYMNMTNSIYNICTRHNGAPVLAQRLINVITNYCSVDIYNALSDLREGAFLSEISRRWEKFKLFVKIMVALFNYLDRFYFNYDASGTGGIEKRRKTIQPRSYELFDDLVFKKFRTETQRLTLSFIDKDRMGEAVDNLMLKNAVDLYILLGQGSFRYYDELEQEFLQRASSYYRNFAVKSLQTDTVPEFMLKAENAFAVESQRITTYMHSKTHLRIKQVLEQELLKKHAQYLINNKETGFLALVEGNRVEDLARMYRLMARLDIALGIRPMADDFRVHISSVGDNMMLNQDNFTKKATTKKVVKKIVKKVIKKAVAAAPAASPDADSAAKAEGAGEDASASSAAPAAEGSSSAATEAGGEETKKVVKKIVKKIVKKVVKKAASASASGEESSAMSVSSSAPSSSSSSSHSDGDDGAGGDENGDTSQASMIYEFVDSIVALYRRYNNLYLHAFQRNSDFHTAIKTAFTEFLNRASDAKPFPVLLAVYVDEFLKSKNAQQADEAVHQRFDEIASLLSFVHEKDKFSAMSRTLLSKRLLDQSGGGSLIQEDAEKALILRLKQQFGNTFTAKMEGMFTDHATASETQEQFRQHLADNNIKLGLELDVQILTQSHWPPFDTKQIQLPAEMAYAVQQFNEYYKIYKKDRNLLWVHSYGSLVLGVRFAKKTCDVTMNTQQAIVLAQFNEGPATVRNLATAVGFDVDVLKNIVASMMQKKMPVLLIRDDTASSSSSSSEDEEAKAKGGMQQLQDTDTLEFNSAMVTAKKKFKLPAPNVITDKTINTIREEVDGERKYQLDAALVRIMKAKRVMQHLDLVTEVISQLTFFKPTGTEIKQRIEDLILREYIERDSKNRNTLKYLP